MKFLGIDWVPFHQPLASHIQTLSTFIHIFIGLLLGPSCTILFIHLLFFTRYYWIVLIYIIYRYFDGHPEKKGSRATSWVRNLPNYHWYPGYFPMKLIKTTDLDPSRNYIFAMFPHGFYSTGGSLCFGTEGLNVSKVFPGIRPSVIVVDLIFKFPGQREILLASGCCSPCQDSLTYLLNDPEGGRAAVLLVGGAAEALLSRPGNMIIVLKRRKGFVKLALENGAPLVPVISFGENELYDQLANPEGSLLRRFQETFKRWTSVSPPIFNGRGFFQYTFGLLPRQRPVTVVVGNPIDVLKVPEPTESQINELHQRFMNELMNMFEENKHKYLEDATEKFLIIE